MANRILPGLIVCFWLVMTSLLILLEVNPDKSNLLNVPPSHILKLMFLHEQISELEVMDGSNHIGNVVLRPGTDKTQGLHLLKFTGNLLLRMPGAPKRQRFSWDGEMQMDPAFAARGMELNFNVPEPAYNLHLNLDSGRRRIDYEIKNGQQTVDRSSITLDEAGLSSLLRELGLDPAMVQNIPAGISVPVITAKQTELKIRKEKIIAYLVTIKQGETTLAEIYVSQLGQVLTAKIITGYSFATEDLIPPP